MKKIPAIIFVTSSVIALNAFSQPLKERPMLDPAAPQPIPQPLLVLQQAGVATSIEGTATAIEQANGQEKSIEQGVYQEPIKGIEQSVQPVNGLFPIPKSVLGKQILDPGVPQPVQTGDRQVKGLYAPPPPILDPAGSKLFESPRVPQPTLQAPLILKGAGVENGIEQTSGQAKIAEQGAQQEQLLEQGAQQAKQAGQQGAQQERELSGALRQASSSVGQAMKTQVNTVHEDLNQSILEASGQAKITEPGAQQEQLLEQGAQQAKQAGQQGAQQERQLSSQLRQTSSSVGQSMKTQVNTVHVDSAQKGGSPSENLTSRSSSTINTSGFLPPPTTTPGKNSTNSLTTSPSMSADSAPTLSAGNEVTGATVTGAVNAPSSNSGISPGSNAGGNPSTNVSQPTNNTN